MRISEEDIRIFNEVYKEELRQDEKWGPQRVLPSSDSSLLDKYGIASEEICKASCEDAMRENKLTWDHILIEELAEVHEAVTWNSRRKELIQLAAVIFQEIKSNDKAFKK